MAVRWRVSALKDITRIIRYVAAENPQAASRLARELVALGDALALFPNRGTPGKHANTRELLAVPPYVLVYRVAENGDATVLRVWHSAQHRG